MKNLPLRWKLTLHTGALASAVMVLFGLGVSWHLYNDGIADLDTEMRAVSHGFFTELDRRRHQIDWNDPVAVDGLFPAITTLYGVEILDHGTVVYRSRLLDGQQFPSLTGRRAFITTRFAGGEVRVAEFVNKGISLRLSAGIHGVQETRDDLLESYLVAAPLVLLLAGYGAWWIARRALAPIEQIAAAAERITAQRLDRRLPIAASRDELARLTTVLNQMIDRLERSFLQATRFTADASHELKTPLTIIRGEIEAALREGDLAPAQEKMLLNLLEETTRLVAITEGLLLLSRADAGKLTLATAPLDLSAMLGDLTEDMEILAERNAITIEAKIPAGVRIEASTQFMRQLLLNLLENAIKYNHHGGTVRVGVTPGRAAHQLAIANTGPGLTPEQAARVFDRFYRGDTSRERSIGGHGLGLSICREIARALDGEISVNIDQPGWTEFRVSLPAARENPSSALRPAPAGALVEIDSLSAADR